MTYWGNSSFQDFMGPNFLPISLLHEYLMTFFAFMSLFTLLALIFAFSTPFLNTQLIHNEFIEMIYTLFPISFLIVLAYFTFMMMYSGEEMMEGMDLTFKTIGHQWYWSYEFSNNLKFDSYLSNNLNFSLLSCDNHIILPSDCSIRNITTSSDVIHSWAIPSLGIKVDTMPGRLNFSSFMIKSIGLFYGQCSEICGVNHAFMPITIESITNNLYSQWVKSF